MKKPLNNPLFENGQGQVVMLQSNLLRREMFQTTHIYLELHSKSQMQLHASHEIGVHQKIHCPFLLIMEVFIF
jgi:hypothetical protein